MIKKLLTTGAVIAAFAGFNPTEGVSQSANSNSNEGVKEELTSTTREYVRDNFEISPQDSSRIQSSVSDSLFTENSFDHAIETLDLTGLIASCEEDATSDPENIIRARDLSSKEVLVDENYTTQTTLTGAKADTVFIGKAIEQLDLTHMEYLNNGDWARTSINSDKVEIAPGAYLNQLDSGAAIILNEQAPTQSISIPLVKFEDGVYKSAVRLAFNNVNIKDEASAQGLFDSYLRANQERANQELESRLEELQSMYEQDTEISGDIIESATDYINELEENALKRDRNWSVNLGAGALFRSQDDYATLAGLSAGLRNGMELGVNYAFNSTNTNDIPLIQNSETVQRPFGDITYVTETFGDESISTSSLSANVLFPVASWLKIGPTGGVDFKDYERNFTDRQFQLRNDNLVNEKEDTFKSTKSYEEAFAGIKTAINFTDGLRANIYLTSDKDFNPSGGFTLTYDINRGGN